MSKAKINDFKIIDLSFIVNEADAVESLESSKEFADSEIGLYSLEARARKLSDGEMLQYNLNGNYSRIELSIVVWEGYAGDDLEEAEAWVKRLGEESEINGVEVNSRDILPDEFDAFQACAPEYFEEEDQGS